MGVVRVAGGVECRMESKKMPPFIVTGLQLQSHDTVQGLECARTLDIKFETSDFDTYFPIIATADGFAMEPTEMMSLSEFCAAICEHNEEVAKTFQ